MRVAAGDMTAVQACMNRYGGLVWSLARRLSPTAADAEDATQEIFTELWRVAHRYDPAIASETAFVATIARRRLVDRHRQALRQKKLEPWLQSSYDERVAVEPEAHLCEEAATAARALEQLRPEQRQVLLMATADGMTHEQIARATGMALGTVKTHIRRGLIRVRELLADPTVTATGEVR